MPELEEQVNELLKRYVADLDEQPREVRDRVSSLLYKRYGIREHGPVQIRYELPPIDYSKVVEQIEARVRSEMQLEGVINNTSNEFYTNIIYHPFKKIATSTTFSFSILGTKGFEPKYQLLLNFWGPNVTEIEVIQTYRDFIEKVHNIVLEEAKGP